MQANDWFASAQKLIPFLNSFTRKSHCDACTQSQSTRYTHLHLGGESQPTRQQAICLGSRERALQSLRAAAASRTRSARETCACSGRQNEPPFILQQLTFPGSKSKRVQTVVTREPRTATCEKWCKTFVYTILFAIPAPILPHKRLKSWIK